MSEIFESHCFQVDLNISAEFAYKLQNFLNGHKIQEQDSRFIEKFKTLHHIEVDVKPKIVTILGKKDRQLMKKYHWHFLWLNVDDNEANRLLLLCKASVWRFHNFTEPQWHGSVI